MLVRNSKVEQRTSVGDVVEVEQPNEADGDAGIANPERLGGGVDDTDGRRLGDRESAHSVKWPVASAQEGDDRASVALDHSFERRAAIVLSDHHTSPRRCSLDHRVDLDDLIHVPEERDTEQGCRRHVGVEARRHLDPCVDEILVGTDDVDRELMDVVT